ncbi:hypothetical protein [Labilithrix luteola]|uniref:hypothetical protein n=1 Tax=Labilithrix luteola TaxID=1391654 RepID=UPI0011BA7FFC|nr:hypothetical protein [Labilithrix luteola]
MKKDRTPSVNSPEASPVPHPESRARATPSETAARVNELAAVMRAGEWRRGVSGEMYAAMWGLSLSTVENLSAEAWRRVCAEANDADAARPTIAGTLAVSLTQAADGRAFSDVARLADVYSKVVGARAPERHEHAHVVAQFEQLPPHLKRARLLEVRAKIDAAIAALPEDAG